ncbi:alpha/beta fold hydrolase [Xanthomonas phaseoli]|uniref:alpha/beta fold hydrolase n=1 Tax=Xanthomonas phaseoli TaxID=1985254 RepID=UPI001E533635|nr:alpha/beta fold hydrolase [Xanthomonas phaseoli]MCC8468229.1 alpha/beta hydrolase [Xanthomonas phaseoli]
MKKCWVAIALLLFCAPAVSAAETGKTPLNDACRVPGNDVHEAGLVQIGGIQQWVTIEGQDCRNPVVLIVHGGPGNPNTPFAHRLFGSWTGDFTIVQWDQRGSGKTYAASKPADGERLTMQRLTQDGSEVAHYASQRLGKPKLILMGGSWGSALSVTIAKANPNLFHAYVGTAQLVTPGRHGVELRQDAEPGPRSQRCGCDRQAGEARPAAMDQPTQLRNPSAHHAQVRSPEYRPGTGRLVHLRSGVRHAGLPRSL